MFILGYYTVKNVHGLQMSNVIEKESKKKERKKVFQEQLLLTWKLYEP